MEVAASTKSEVTYADVVVEFPAVRLVSEAFSMKWFVDVAFVITESISVVDDANS